MATNGVLASSLRLERRAVRRALYAGLLVGLSTIGLAATSAWLIVRAAQEPVVLSLTLPMGLVQLFALAKASGRYLERTQTHQSALSVMGHVRARVARVLEPLVPAGLGPRSADAVDLVVRDVDRVQDLLTAVAAPLFTSAVAGVATVVVSGLIVPWSALTLAGALAMSAVVAPVAAARLGEGPAGPGRGLCRLRQGVGCRAFQRTGEGSLGHHRGDRTGQHQGALPSRLRSGRVPRERAHQEGARQA